jgi:hypothetical protein
MAQRPPLPLAGFPRRWWGDLAAGQLLAEETLPIITEQRSSNGGPREHSSVGKIKGLGRARSSRN